MSRRFRAIGVGFASVGLLAASLTVTASAVATDHATSDVSRAKWQRIWADVGYPNTADKWRCYGTPRQLNRDPSWVIVRYRPIETAECTGLPGDPYPVLARKQAGTWRDVAMLGPVSCSYVSEEIVSAGGSWGIVRDLMKDGWCWADPMWTAYMQRYLDTRMCAKPLTHRPHEYAVGFIGRSEVGNDIEDGAVTWTCSRAAGSVKHQYLTVFLAQPKPKQITLALDMVQLKSLAIRKGRIIVKGGQYSGDGPLCCPDLRVTVFYEMRGGVLIEVKKKVEPV